MLRSAPLEIIPFAAAGLPLAQNWAKALMEADTEAERAGARDAFAPVGCCRGRADVSGRLRVVRLPLFSCRST
jgi:hypothetical protein